MIQRANQNAVEVYVFRSSYLAARDEPTGRLGSDRDPVTRYQIGYPASPAHQIYLKAFARSVKKECSAIQFAGVNTPE